MVRVGTLAAMAFRGWPTEAIDFSDSLQEDNTKSFWHAHSPVYDHAVKGPMGELLAVQLSAAGLAAGSGMYVMATDQLERYRYAVDADASTMPELARR